MTKPMLEVADLHAYYGKSHVLHGVNLYVNAGEIVCLLGRNGVGRSTTAKAVMGQVVARGQVRFKGRDILGMKAYEIARLGIGLVPEDRSIFQT
ncbi:MAG: ATP-binding cassette domain-containing protein [Sulfuritalea sp.]|nr:ATP-binding cassette domain-containing protein [Sulfuritalea sp.]